MFALVAGSNALMCAWLIPSGGLKGAATAVLVSSLVHLVASTAVLFYVLMTRAKSPAENKDEPSYGSAWEPGV